MRRFILGGVYVFARALVKLMFGVYFSEQRIVNSKNLSKKGPLILLSNHPNGMLDPINVAARSRRMVHFLAKAELFRHPFLNWFFNTLYCIPIERPDFMSGNKVDNTQNFERCNQFLKESGALYIAPEGTSLLVRRLLPLKTGAARIALQAEASMNFEMGLQLVPAGITYVNQGEFRSKYYMEVGEAITVSSFKEQYASDPKDAVNKLTDLLESKMQKHLIQLDSDEYMELFEYLIRVLQIDIESDPVLFYTIGKALANRLNYLDKNEKEKLQTIVNEVARLKQISTHLNLKRTDIPDILTKWSSTDWLKYIVIFLVYLPLFIGGFLVHIIPNGIIWLIERLAGLHIIYKSTVKMLSGLILYPLIYSFKIWLIWHFTHDIDKVIFFAISLVFSGYLFYPILNLYRKLYVHFRTLFMSPGDYNILRIKILTLKDLINN